MNAVWERSWGLVTESLWGKNHKKFLKHDKALGLAIILTGLIPLIPDELSISVILFCSALGYYIVVRAITEPFLFSAKPDWPAIFLSIFFFSYIASIVIGLLAGHSIPDVFRSAVPFCFFALFWFISSDYSEDKQSLYLDAVFKACVVWAVKVIFQVAGSIQLLLSGDVSRVTQLAKDSLTPFSLIGLLLVMFSELSIVKKYRFAWVSFYLIINIALGYRAQLGLIVLCFVLMSVRLSRVERVTILILILGLVVGVYAVLGDSIFMKAFLNRIQDVEGELSGSRREEILYAVSQWRKWPIFGAGLGGRIPLSVTYHGFSDAYVALNVTEDYVLYLHNIVSYFLLNFGVVGLIGFLGFIFSSIWQGFRRGMVVSFREADNHAAAILVIGNVFILYFVQPFFRHIQINIIMVVMLVIVGGVRGIYNEAI